MITDGSGRQQFIEWRVFAPTLWFSIIAKA
jgi:hypothetical protein